MKNFVMVIIIMFSALSESMAQVSQNLSIAIPSAPGQYQSDHFRAGDLDCSNAIGAGTNVEFGVMGLINNNGNTIVSSDPTQQQGKNVGVYGRIMIPIGAPKERINCNTLYQLELTKKRLEVEKLEEELKQLKRLKFENKK